jgi:hypothetical protein
MPYAREYSPNPSSAVIDLGTCNYRQLHKERLLFVHYILIILGLLGRGIFIL